jgi:four helix bundle protein
MSDPLKEKSYAFALRIVKLSEHLQHEKKEFVLSRKILDSGVNISLLIEEARQGENRADFLQKYSVATKESFKTNLLLRLLRDSEYMTGSHADSFIQDREELQKMLVSAVKKTRSSTTD